MTREYKGHQIDFDREVCVICGATRNQIDDDGVSCQPGGRKFVGKIPGEPAPPRADRKPRKAT